jgi:hypothetical protein
MCHIMSKRRIGGRNIGESERAWRGIILPKPSALTKLTERSRLVQEFKSLQMQHACLRITVCSIESKRQEPSGWNLTLCCVTPMGRYYAKSLPSRGQENSLDMTGSEFKLAGTSGTEY